jgi:hypothetical protein
LQQFSAYFHPFYDNYQLDLHEGKNAVGGVTHQSDNLEQCLDISLFSYKDPFAVLLESVSSPKFSYFFKFKFVCKFLKLPISRFLILSLRKDMQKAQIMDKTLAWMHWIYDFT